MNRAALAEFVRWVQATLAGDEKGQAQLLALNLDVAGRLDRGETVTAPGLPPGFPAPQRLIISDCIQPPI